MAPCAAPWRRRRKLTELINETHENAKYLPGCPLGDNVVACADLVETVRWVAWAGAAQPIGAAPPGNVVWGPREPAHSLAQHAAAGAHA